VKLLLRNLMLSGFLLFTDHMDLNKRS